jgi:hypothetical protein
MPKSLLEKQEVGILGDPHRSPNLECPEWILRIDDEQRRVRVRDHVFALLSRPHQRYLHGIALDHEPDRGYFGVPSVLTVESDATSGASARSRWDWGMVGMFSFEIGHHASRASVWLERVDEFGQL